MTQVRLTATQTYPVFRESIDFFSVVEGKLSVTLKRHRNIEPSDKIIEMRELTIGPGDCLDSVRVTELCGSYHYVTKITCITRSCKLFSLSNRLIQKVSTTPHLLSIKDRVVEVSPPMEGQSEKFQAAFLALFRLEILTKGTILAKEGSEQSRVFIVIDGDVTCFKKLYPLESNDCPERDDEHVAICQN